MMANEERRERSANFDLIKGYYDKGLWSMERVRNVVGKPGGVTQSEFYEIIGGEILI
jgi:hypothetical protein